ELATSATPESTFALSDSRSFGINEALDALEHELGARAEDAHRAVLNLLATRRLPLNFVALRGQEITAVLQEHGVRRAWAWGSPQDGGAWPHALEVLVEAGPQATVCFATAVVESALI